MQGLVPELVGACLVMATRYGLDLPQPLLEPPALAALINVPTGKLLSMPGICFYKFL